MSKVIIAFLIALLFVVVEFARIIIFEKELNDSIDWINSERGNR